MKMKLLMRSKWLGWSLYGMLVLGLLGTFIHVIKFGEVSDWHFNRTDNGAGKPYIEIDIDKIDYENNSLDCVINIPRHSDLNIRLVHVMSWEYGEFFKKNRLGPNADVYFIFPSEDEIYSGKMKTVEHLRRPFRFKLFSGNPALYPFDAYNVEFGIMIAQKQPLPSLYPAVITYLHEYLPGFYMSDMKDTLTFQEELSEDNPMRSKNMFSFRLVRIKFLRYFTVYIYGLACLFLVHIAFSHTTGKLFGQALGYFAALWGIRNIITDKVEIFPTLVDYITLGLYSILILIIIGRLLNDYYSSREA